MDLQSPKDEAPEEYDEYSKYVPLPKSKGPVNIIYSGAIYTIPNKTSQNDEMYDGKYTTPYEKHAGVLVNKGAVSKKCVPHTQANQEKSNTYTNIHAIETVKKINYESPHSNETQNYSSYDLPKLSRVLSDPKMNEDTSK